MPYPRLAPIPPHCQPSSPCIEPAEYRLGDTLPEPIPSIRGYALVDILFVVFKALSSLIPQSFHPLSVWETVRPSEVRLR